MRVTVVSPPAPLIDLATAKTHLRVDSDDEDVLIQAYIDAATAHIDGPGGWLGRALGKQTLEARLDRFEEATLPYPPFVSVTSVKYLGDDGELTVAPSLYEAIGARIVPVNGVAWPATAYRAEAVRVQYVAGYEQVPASILAAILLMVDDLYRNRGEAVIGTISSKVDMSPTVAALLSPFRVWC